MLSAKQAQQIVEMAASKHYLNRIRSTLNMLDEKIRKFCIDEQTIIEFHINKDIREDVIEKLSGLGYCVSYNKNDPDSIYISWKKY